MKFKLILCDLGNCLVRFDHRIATRRILAFTDKDLDTIYQLFFDSALTKDYEEGRISSLDFFRRLKRRLNLGNLNFTIFKSIWNEIFFDNEGMVELLRTLKKKYRLHMISNINELHYRYLLKKFPEHLRLFDKIFLSYEVGRRKPHRKIYLRAIQERGVKPQEVLYTDDRADLLKEAKKLGIQTVLFKNVEDFKKQLKKLKVLP